MTNFIITISIIMLICIVIVGINKYKQKSYQEERRNLLKRMDTMRV